MTTGSHTVTVAMDGFVHATLWTNQLQTGYNILLTARLPGNVNKLCPWALPLDGRQKRGGWGGLSRPTFCSNGCMDTPIACLATP